MNDYQYADVCGNGQSGNARYYAPVSIHSSYQQNRFDSASPPINPLFSHLPLYRNMASPTFNIASLFRNPESQDIPKTPATQLGLVLEHQRLDRQRLQAQQQQQQQQQQEQAFKPNKPQFADYQTRLKTFDDPRWPSDCPVSPTDLAEAGFYYYGEVKGADRRYFDAVECFFCGKGVCRWVPGDDAWSEHRRVSPNCLFVHDLKNRFKRGEIKTEPISESTSLPTSQPSSMSTSNASSQCSSTYASDDEGYSSQNSQSSQDPLQCKVCLQREISVTFIPCSHCVSCIECSLVLKTCPICREPIGMSIRSFHA